MKIHKDDINTLLENHHLKKTPGRLNLLQLLEKSPHPLSIEQIKKHLSVNVTTIYRILETLVEKGIVYQTNFRDGKAYFEFQHHHHHHVTCTTCGLQEDVDICIAKNLGLLEKGLKKFTTINSHMLEFFSTCNKCQK